jgi:hypothetical protein
LGHIVVHRLLAGPIGIDRDPLGADIWKNTTVVLPENFRLTGNVITDDGSDCRGRLPKEKALESFPWRSLPENRL